MAPAVGDALLAAFPFAPGRGTRAPGRHLDLDTAECGSRPPPLGCGAGAAPPGRQQWTAFLQAPALEHAGGRPRSSRGASHQNSSSFVCCCASNVKPHDGPKRPYTKQLCEGQRNFQYPKKVIWHPETHKCCYANRLSCITTILGAIPIGMHGKMNPAAMCEEGGTGQLVPFADKTMAVNRMIITLNHQAGKQLIGKVKGIATAGLAPAMSGGLGVSIDGNSELTVNDVRKDVMAVNTLKRVCNRDDISGTRDSCKMMFDEEKDKAYLVLPPRKKIEEDKIIEEDKDKDGDDNGEVVTKEGEKVVEEGDMVKVNVVKEGDVSEGGGDAAVEEEDLPDEGK